MDVVETPRTNLTDLLVQALKENPQARGQEIAEVVYPLLTQEDIEHYARQHIASTFNGSFNSLLRVWSLQDSGVDVPDSTSGPKAGLNPLKDAITPEIALLSRIVYIKDGMRVAKALGECTQDDFYNYAEELRGVAASYTMKANVYEKVAGMLSKKYPTFGSLPKKDLTIAREMLRDVEMADA